MKKRSTDKHDDDLRPEYDLSQLKRRVRGKYHKRATSGVDIVLVEADLSEALPDIGSVSADLLTVLIGRTDHLGPERCLELATRSADPPFADPYLETRSAKG